MNKLKIVAAAIALSFAANASAAWIWVADPDLTDDAINPGPANVAPAGPDNQSPADIEVWLEDLTNQSVTYLAGADNTPDVLGGLDALGAVYIVLHYGNYQGDIPAGFELPTIPRGQGTVETSNVNIAYECDGLTSCDSFDPPNAGLSNYRIFGANGVNVPEPGTLALLSLGLIGLAIGRRRA